MDRRTKEELKVSRLEEAHYIMESTPSMLEFYSYYMDKYECCIDTARKEYRLSMELVAERLNDKLDILRANRLVRLQSMLAVLKQNKDGIALDKLVPMQLAVEKQMAELEGLKNFTTKVETTIKQINLND